MAKFLADAGLDTALAWFVDCDRLVLCSSQPTTYAELTTFKLGEAVPGFDAAANGDTSGRKRRVQVETGISITASGTCTHLGLGKSGDSTLRAVTTTTSQAVASGGTADTNAWDIEVGDPT